MVSRELKETILEVVDNQLSMNEPKCTTDTFERLVASGYSLQEAKERIAEVLLDRMTASLATGKAFDEAEFAKRLYRIKGKGKQRSANIEPSKKTMAELVNRIKYHPEIEFPEEALKEIVARKEEAIPLLLDILKQIRDNPGMNLADGDYFGHIYALDLLAQSRVEEAYPLVLELISLPSEQLYGLFGDMIADSAGRILASICGDDVAPIKGIIENESVDKYVRVEAITALAILALDGEIEREELIEYYRGIFRTIDDPGILALLINLCTDIYPGELYDEIREAYENDRVDSFVIDMESVEQAMREGEASLLAKAKKNRYLQKINDTIGELREWAYIGDFEDGLFDLSDIWPEKKRKPTVNEPKIGRNDPCPCGSGKKYKKCCGK